MGDEAKPVLDLEEQVFPAIDSEEPIRVARLPAMHAAKLLVKLIGMAGPGLMRIAGSGVDAQEDPEKVGMADAANGVMMIFEKLTPAEFEAIANQLLEHCSWKGTPLKKVANALFQGKTMTLFAVLGFALRVNYSDFYDAVAANLAKFLAQWQSRFGTSTKRPSSSGDAGASSSTDG